MSDFIGHIELGQLRVREYKDGTDFIINGLGVSITKEQAQKLGRWLLEKDDQ